MATTEAIKPSHLSPYKSSSPSSITKDLKSTNIKAKIVPNSTYKPHVTTSSQIVCHTSEFQHSYYNIGLAIAEAT